MKQTITVEQNLTLRSNDGPAEAAEALTLVLNAPWGRDIEKERGARTDPRQYIFRVEGGGSVHLVSEGQSLVIANVFPTQEPDDDANDYERIKRDIARQNRLIRRFYNEIVAPNASSLGLRAHITSEDQTLAELLGDQVAQYVDHFGARHPGKESEDRKLWFDLVICAHRAGTVEHFDIAARWLYENCHWASEDVEKYGTEYERLLALLKHYDENPADVDLD